MSIYCPYIGLAERELAIEITLQKGIHFENIDFLITKSQLELKLASDRLWKKHILKSTELPDAPLLCRKDLKLTNKNSSVSLHAMNLFISFFLIIIFPDP